jgi:hypothetical protein
MSDFEKHVSGQLSATKGDVNRRPKNIGHRIGRPGIPAGFLILANRLNAAAPHGAATRNIYFFRRDQPSR